MPKTEQPTDLFEDPFEEPTEAFYASCQAAQEGESGHSNYLKYRGKCKEFCEAEIEKDHTLVMVRGHYFCPLWNTDEPHWWCVRPDGTIVDPTRLQFPSAGAGIYTPFDGLIECAQCGKEMEEKAASFYGNYAFCSTPCTMRFVGL